MAVVEYTFEEIHKLIDLSKEEIIDGLNNLGAPTEIDEETKKIKSEITPNRPDWYCVEGLVRSLKCFFKGKKTKYSAKKSNGKYVVNVEAEVEKIRPFTACAVVKGIKFTNDRIKDIVLLQEKLVGTLGRKVKKFGLGIYPLDQINFPIRYTAKKPNEIKYKPLGYEVEMNAEQILNEHKKGKEHGHLLKGFDRYPVFIDAKDNVMALIPIVNSNELGKVEEKTKDVFIEVSGEEFESVKNALNILVCSFADLGGEVYEVEVKYLKEKKSFHLPELEEKKMHLDLEIVNKLLGQKFDGKTVKKYLEKMGYEFNEKDTEVLIPPYRIDVLDESDIIEDIAIAHGYNNFPYTLPNFFHMGKGDKKYNQVDEIFKGMGFLEIKTFILTNKNKIEKIDKKFENQVVEIINPLGEEYNIVRPTIVGDMLETFKTNKMKKTPQMFYEVGIVNRNNKTKKKVIFGICGKKIDFSSFRGYLQVLFKELQMEFELEKQKISSFDEEISGNILINKKGHKENIGIFGKVDRKTLMEFELENEIYLAEIDLEQYL